MSCGAAPGGGRRTGTSELEGAGTVIACRVIRTEAAEEEDPEENHWGNEG